MMFRKIVTASTIFIMLTASAIAQEPVVGNPDHAKMLASSDPKLAENKKLVYDFWRTVLDAAQFDRAQDFLTEEYIQHNPNVPSGRQAFIDFFKRIKKPSEVQERVAVPLVSMTAENDLVVMSFAREYDDPKNPGQKYTTTWFDMFRIENGKIAEHWDSALKRP